MNQVCLSASSAATQVRLYGPRELAVHVDRWAEFATSLGDLPLSRHPGWLIVLKNGLKHAPYCLEATDAGLVRGLLPLSYMSSLLFGRFLVSLPYVNYGGVLADDDEAAGRLLDGAAELADELGVRYLEVRHEKAIPHAVINHSSSHKVHMRRALPDTPERLWKQLNGKVRNQVGKGERSELTVHWGGHALLDEFYTVFSQHMRDLGTPVYGRGLFKSILEVFPDRAEFCVVRAGSEPAGAALLLHGWGITEVPSASTRRDFHHTCANMLMYWHLLKRAIERGQRVFDFGRCSPDSNTFRFKKQWGALPNPATWQYYVRRGSLGDMRADNPKYQRFIRIWQRLPVPVTRWLGPRIVRGIP